MAWILSSGPSLNEEPGVSPHWTAFSSTGPQGPQGLKGDKGEKGDTGSQGIQGEQGIPGSGAGNIYIDNINNLDEFYTGDKVAIQLTHIPDKFISEDRNIPLAYSAMNWSDGVGNLYTYIYNQNSRIPSTLHEQFQAEILLNGNVYTAIFKETGNYFQ